VELQRTLHTNVPGILFGVKAEAFNNEDDSPVKGASTCCWHCHLQCQIVEVTADPGAAPAIAQLLPGAFHTVR
jgi:hypothetical protein